MQPRRQVARAADTNRDGEVSAAEWTALLRLLDPAHSGQVDSRELMVRVTLPMIERSEDGSLDLDDIFQIFAELDRNKDDALDARELAPRMTLTGTSPLGPSPGGSSTSMAVLALRSADLNDDGEVDPDEFGSFVDALGLELDGSIKSSEVAAWIDHEAEHQPGEQGFNAGSIVRWVREELDRDGDGRTEVALLAGYFARLDKDSDGALSSDELKLDRSFGLGGISEEERAKPALMPWQRNLEDAMALVQESGKPLLICVNMDDEFASESFAWSRYRDPNFVRLVDGFVPLLVSPNRHNPRDYDDRGRRLSDQRFGRLVNAEHIDIEAELYARYFGGKRSAPRHLGIAADGQVLFDIYLDNDLSLVDKALREHGKPSAVEALEVDLQRLDEVELLASQDARYREELERRFVEGDERQRVRLAGLSLSAARRAQHPELLRLALADAAESVRLQAVWSMAQHPKRAALEFFGRAYSVASADERAREALLSALGQLGAAGSQAAWRESEGQATRLLRALLGQRLASEHVDVQRWRAAISWAPSAAQAAELSQDQLVENLRAAQQALNLDALDPEANLAFAAASMGKAQFVLREGGNPGLLLEDVLAAGRRAAQAAPEDGRAGAYMAWAQYLLGDHGGAVEHAARALQALVPWAGSPLAGRALELLAELRMGAVYQAIELDEMWSAAWVADVRAANTLLLLHPYGREQHALAYVDFLNALGLVGPQEEFLRAALQRSPSSAALHAKLREQLLRDGTARDLERAYPSLEVAPELASEQRWYAGLAWFMAAERHVQNRQGSAAQGAYRESAERFAACLEARSEFAEPASQYLCLSLAGLAKLQLEAKSWLMALASLRAGVVAAPESVWKKDGLGNTPREIAQLLYRSLLSASLEEDARGLRRFLAENGLEIEG